MCEKVHRLNQGQSLAINNVRNPNMNATIFEAFNMEIAKNK